MVLFSSGPGPDVTRGRQCHHSGSAFVPEKASLNVSNNQHSSFFHSELKFSYRPNINPSTAERVWPCELAYTTCICPKPPGALTSAPSPSYCENFSLLPERPTPSTPSGDRCLQLFGTSKEGPRHGLRSPTAAWPGDGTERTRASISHF